MGWVGRAPASPMGLTASVFCIGDFVGVVVMGNSRHRFSVGNKAPDIGQSRQAAYACCDGA
jgi:hypothetical protein